MSDEFTYQYAIRCPNGELFKTSDSSSMSWLFGTPSEPKVVIYDSRPEAESALQQFQNQAARMGITWTAWVEQRICSPFTVTDPAECFSSEVAEWLEGQS